MKIVLYLISIILTMGFSEFHILLGKHISEASVFGDVPKLTSQANKYYVSIEPQAELYGIQYSHVIINTNDKDIIDSFSVYFSEVINRYFYDSFIDNYDSPKSIQIVDEIKNISKSSVEEPINRISEKNFLTLKEGTFEEMPLYIRWENEKFEIKILLKHERNMSEISFKLASKKK